MLSWALRVLTLLEWLVREGRARIPKNAREHERTVGEKGELICLPVYVANGFLREARPHGEEV